MKRCKLARLYCLKNTLNYKKFMMLNSEHCVYISSSYFWYLVVRAQHKATDNSKVFEILNKYNDIEDMKNCLGKNKSRNDYFLICYDDAKYLVRTLKVPEFRHSFIKSSVKVSDFETWYKKLKEEYEEKKSQISVMGLKKVNK